MSETPKPTSPSAPRVQPGGITSAAAAAAAAPRMEGEQWEWGLSGPAPVSLPASMAAGGLTAEAAQRPVAPPAAHVHVEGRLARETVWNPLEGDPLRMAALGAAAEVQQGGWVPQPPVAASATSDNGNGAVAKATDATRSKRRDAKADVAAAKRTAPAVEADDETVGTSTTPPGARLRPVTGRRQREPLPATISITAGSYRSNLSPPLPSGGGAAPAASAMMTMSSGEEGNGTRAPWSTRARVLVGLVVALVVAAGAAAAIVVAMPPRVVLQVSLAYERDGGAATIDDRALREFQQGQEGLLWSRAVRDAAQEALAKRGVDVEPGFLGNTNQLARGSGVQWNGNADATREELVVEYGTSAAEADADRERLAALFQAMHAAAAAQGSAGRVGELKLQLLEGELADYTRELEYLKRRLQTLEEELRIVRLGAPKEGEVEAMKSEVSRLSVGYQNALSERVRAEVEAGVAPRPATGPVEGVLPPLEPGASGVEQLRRLERDALVALRTAERHLAEASAQEDAIGQKEREMKGATDTMDSLSRSLEEKRKELAAAGEERRAVFKPLPPSPARVVEEKDDRPLWIGVAVAAVSFCFAGYVALTSRGGGGGGGGGGRHGAA